MKRSYLMFVFILLLTSFQSVCAVPEFEVKITADDGARSDEFGRSVSISGDYAIVGSHEDNDNGQSSGSAYVYMREDQNWLQQVKLLPDDGARRDLFGYSVAIDGDYAIVGAYNDDDNGEDSGSAYIFVREDDNWVQQDKLTAEDGAAADFFGVSVSISGDYAIIGAYGDDNNGEQSGSAYIFMRNGEDWVQQVKLLAEDADVTDFFGSSVSISDDYAIVGAFGGDENGYFSGSAYIFFFDGVEWTQQEKLTADDGEDGDLFGKSVSISGDFAVAGSSLDDDNANNSGSVYIFARAGQEWRQQEKLVTEDGRAGEQFGFSVSISGDYLIAGAHQQDDNGNGSGSVYVYILDGENWILQEEVTANDRWGEDGFAHSASIGGDHIIVGAYLDDDNGDQSGSAYIFTFQDLITIPDWLDFGEVVCGEQAVLDLDIIYYGIENPITITEISTVSEYFTTDFEADIIIQPRDTAGVQITFAPDIVREYRDAITVVTNNAYIGDRNTGMAGTGVEGNSVDDKPARSTVEKYTQFKASPNPFNSSTTISYSLPTQSPVTLRVYNTRGQLVNVLEDGVMAAGRHTVVWDGCGVSAGVYVVRVCSGVDNWVGSSKVVLVR